MKAPSIPSAIVLTGALILAISLAGNVSAVDTVKNNPVAIKHESLGVHKIEHEIDADRDKIIEESNAIKADRRKLKEAEKASDKANAEQIKKDIVMRDAKIKDLKKEISDKKGERYLLMNGKQKDEPRRTRRDAK